ncbi:hypothetical protein [Klebsiella phage pKP-BM327-1.2]|nr:hypothetical protein [Klebsiella phage pKP-BM327-1.2]
MGLFSGKKKTYRDFSYSRLIEDDYLPDVMGQAITTYVLDKDNTKSLTDLMLEYGWSANNVKWDAAYRWAKKGKYFYGLPTTTAVTATDFTGSESLEDVLQALTGHTDLTYVYSKFVSGNFRHGMWQQLISTQNYNATTNILGSLTSSLGTTCWLHNAINYLTSETREAVEDTMLEHWGLSPKSGATNIRSQDLNAADTPDEVSATGSNYVRVEYACSFAGVERIKTVETTKVTTTIKTPDPNEEGSYTEETSSTSSDTTTNTTNWNGVTLPDNVISSVDVGTGTSEVNESDPVDTQTTVDETTGVITEVVTEVTRVITTNTVSVNVIAYFNMSFGVYDYNPDTETIDTTTVLDDQDSGDYDPTAPLVPSGEDTDDSPDYFMVCYEYMSGSTLHIGYFTYEYGSGNYPALDGITGTEVADFGQHFPRMYFRLNGKRLISDDYSQTEGYKTSKKLGNKLDLDWLEVGDEIYNSLSSLSKVRDVLLILQVPANTENVIEREYLFNYFYTLCNIRPEYTETMWDNSGNTGGSEDVPTSDLDTYKMHIGGMIKSEDTDIATYNNMDLLGYAKITGSIGPKGSVTSGYAEDGVIPTKNSDGTYGTKSMTYHFYKFQSSDTEYEEVRVYELTHSVRVGGSKVTRGHEHDQLMVPLDHAFRKMFSTHDRETLYARALQILICTEYTVKTKWYQTGLFQAVTVVVAVAVSWWTGGASLSLISALTAVATAAGTMIAFSLLSKYVFSKLGSWASILATVVAVVAAVYGGYVYFSGSTGPFSLTAKNLMQISNIAFKASDASMKGQQIAMQQKLGSLQKELEEKQEVLQQAQDELNQGSNTISDWIFLQATNGYVNLGETADQMIARTLNTNIGALALQLPDMYLSQALSLPSSVEIMQFMQQKLYTVPDDELNPLM